MYGIVNKAIEELVVANFGEDKWDAIKLRSGIDIDYFISSEPYDDAITFQLAIAVSQEKYGGLMEAGGDNLKQFLINLPLFHNRVMLIYPKLTPPEFKVTNVTENSINLHYLSKREGLQDFVRGLIQGLGIMYSTPVTINLIQTRDEGSSHEVFNIIW